MNRSALIAGLLVAGLALVPACDITQSPAPTAQRSVVRGNGGEPGTLDPALADDVHAFNILGDLYEGLVTESADGRLVPGVAASWTISDDGRTYTFSLDQAARWADGTRVTATDFVRAFRRIATPATASTYAVLLEPIEGMSASLAGDAPPDRLGVQAVDDETLVLSLNRPTNHLLSLLAMPVAYPAHVDGNIGNGAFVIESREPGGAITLVRNPHYRDSRNVRIDSVTYLPVADLNTELNMFLAGEIDITNSVPAEFIRTTDGKIGGNLHIAPTLAVYYLAFDMTAAPLGDARLRRALSMAIDRQAIVSILGRGEIPAFGIVPPGVDGYHGVAYEWQSMSDSGRRQAAEGAFREAGFGEENPLSLRLLYDTGDVHETIAVAIAAMWRDVLDIDVELEKREWAYFLDSRARRNEWDVMRFIWFGDYNSPMTFLEIFASDSTQNLARYQNDLFDEALQLASGSADAMESADAMRKAESLLLDDYPIAPLYFLVSKHLVSHRVRGFEDNALDRHPSRFLAIDAAAE